VIDTDVFSADLVPGSGIAERYAAIITGRPAFISFQTPAELRYGALRRGWGSARMLRLEAKIQRAEVVHTGPELVLVCARLRVDCEAAGHALGQREHNADRWIAATAIRLGVRSSPTPRSSRECQGSRSRRPRAPDCAGRTGSQTALPRSGISKQPPTRTTHPSGKRAKRGADATASQCSHRSAAGCPIQCPYTSASRSGPSAVISSPR